MDTRIPFYGTPLNRSLADNQADSESPANSRRSRLNYQQTVRDDQGRQRFHGAFTGGFSAGYFNTVGTAEGFKPKQFVTHRRNKQQDCGPSKFIHRPEDYMDDEDLGEFGIAPRKIRVNNQYLSGDDDTLFGTHAYGSKSTFISIPATNTTSIGEEILSRSESLRIKNDFHGLGYKPLSAYKIGSKNSKPNNPLMAVLGGEKRLKVSGEAFGSGVFEDEDDCIDTSHAYGYDDIGNYEFIPRTSRSTHPPACEYEAQGRVGQQDHDCGPLPGFILAKDSNSMQICDNLIDIYPPPFIASDWQMPVMKKSSLTLARTFRSSHELELKVHQSSDLFNKKFICASETIKSGNLEMKAGLVHYSDLKVAESISKRKTEPIIDSKNSGPTIIRKKLEWRPCSLLCKRFNVPNPHPDNLYAGVKPSDLIEQNDLKSPSPESRIEVSRKSASMELKRSIFNVAFEEQPEEKEGVLRHGESDVSEDEPQILEVEDTRLDHEYKQGSDEDQDIMIVTVPRPEPELIVLSSSSPSLSATPPQTPLISTSDDNDERHPRGEENNVLTDIETYGPPLPPAYHPSPDSHRPRRAGCRRARIFEKRTKKGI